jgi:PAS domain S-box-containing protein
MLFDFVDSSNYAFNPYAVPLFFTCFATVLLGIVVLFRERFSQEGILFHFTTIFIGFWLFCFGWMYSALDDRVAFWWARSAYLAVPFIPSAVYHFTVVVLHVYERYKKLVWVAWTVSIFFAVSVVATDALLVGLYRYSWGYYPRYDALSVPYLTFFFAMMVASMIRFWTEYRRAYSGSIHKRRTLLLMIAFAVLFFASFDYLAKFGLPIYPFGYVMVFLFLLISAHAIWHYRLVNLTPAFAANQILEAMPGAIFVVDSDGLISVVNRSACNMMGYSEQQLLGKSIGGFFETYSVGDMREESIVKGHALRDHIMRWRTKEGAAIDVSVSTAAIKNPYGGEGPAGVVYVALDITERKKAQEALLQKTIELARSNAETEQLQLFAYVASHDLREPLQKIVGFGDLLKLNCAKALGEKGADYLERMQNATIRMSELIEDILKFSRVTTQEERFEAVDLTSLAHEVLSDLEVRVLESKAVIDVGAMPIINADRAQMRQLFQNLIGNAIKFHKKDEPPRVWIMSRSLEGGLLEISVKDNGVGFEEKYLEKIFKPFERLHSRAEYPGSGIGLAICQKIARGHGGDITAKSSPGNGAVFTVVLPATNQRGKI